MISGPTIPNTLNSLRDLLVQRVELIEHGLRVMSEDLVLGHDVRVDVLACDATGAPMLQFIAVPETAAQLPARVLGAQAWWRQNAAFLARELADPHLRIELAPRFLVIGLDILADTLDELRRMRVEGLTVSQLCSFTVGGRLRLGLTVLLESEPSGAVPARDGFMVPTGIVDPGQRALAARFLDLMRRVDTGMTATGDRFSRRLFLGGRYVAQLGLSAGKLNVEFPALADGFEAQWMELTEATCLAAVDRMLRLVLAIELVDGPDGDADPFDAPGRDSAGRDAAGRDAGGRDAGTTAGANAPDVAAPIERDAYARSSRDDVAEEDCFSLEPIRRSVARAQLSREEFSALGDEGSDSA